VGPGALCADPLLLVVPVQAQKGKGAAGAASIELTGSGNRPWPTHVDGCENYIILLSQ
jgi:hypothetical protein